MDEMDSKLVKALRRDGRASVSELSADLGVTRATVKARMDRLRDSGEIAGFTVVTRSDVAAHAVRGLMMLGIEGRGTEKVMRTLTGLVEVQAVHSTNGTWDLIVEIGTETLDALDEVLFRIRRLDGVTRSETSLLLSTRRAGR
ncbi:Lrp/AsnC family transcriptional regulator [Octadecabacter sp. 1_MG-2023]|uniref:Lrp/AsnC family transcriptional regulator n=1 Tax=unclassified Octadecabacter TaxID=196158 RepID=UPI001C093EC2|nr:MULTISPECIES: Lrp/AsnC family transcriptional regulator [unclassified Octadecabacter]MBU2993239.1 Lrp/AsnC family transcriptional regulator [Octadecabacter sp. B2R22]MDO6733306.1 Lrp/AsnC family transcriptional regulator [Octadecabacter sp. 1_MG-2023]